MRFLLISYFVVSATSSAMAQEIRIAGEAEIAAALAGCWSREATFENLRAERKGFIHANTLCFGPKNQFEAISVDGHEKWGVDGVSSGGTFRVADGKLHLSSSGDGWFFVPDDLSCDLVMRLDVAMQFRNCIGGDGTTVTNSSYSRADE